MNAIDTAPRIRAPLKDQPAALIYNEVESILVSHTDRAAVDENGTADAIFESTVSSSASFHPRHLKRKRAHWRALAESADRAIRCGACLRYSRANKDLPAVFRNVIEAAIEQELFHEVRSPPGAGHQSRLIPSQKLQGLLADYRPCLAARDSRPIIIRTKEDEEMPIDLNHPTVCDYRSKLELINRVNSGSDITYRKYDEYEDQLRQRLPCYPQHQARFQGDFNHGGRMYGGGRSHQNLRRIERQSIEFNGCPSVELDLSCCQARMCYHSLGIDRRGDLYFTNSNKLDPRRFLRKRVLLVALNSTSRNTTVYTCREMENVRTASGQYKTGEGLRTARHLRDARLKTGLVYAAIYDDLLRTHAPIAQFFRKGTTMELQPRESRIALNVMHHFALQGIPCLSVYDSFLVPAEHGHELREAIVRCYFDEFGFLPEIDGEHVGAPSRVAA